MTDSDIRTYRAATIHQALQMVEEELGRDAVILHTRQIEQRRWLPWQSTQEEVEVTAGIGWTVAGEWLSYTVEVLADGTYAIEMPVASNKQGGLFHLEIDGNDLTGPIRIPDTGGWTILKKISHKGVKLKKGVHRIRVVMDEVGPSSNIGDIDYFKFTRID